MITRPKEAWDHYTHVDGYSKKMVQTLALVCWVMHQSDAEPNQNRCVGERIVCPDTADPRLWVGSVSVCTPVICIHDVGKHVDNLITEMAGL